MLGDDAVRLWEEGVQIEELPPLRSLDNASGWRIMVYSDDKRGISVSHSGRFVGVWTGRSWVWRRYVGAVQEQIDQLEQDVSDRMREEHAGV